jgi:hypothetical protein
VLLLAHEQLLAGGDPFFACSGPVSDHHPSSV